MNQSVRIQIQYESVSTDTDVQTHSVNDVKTRSVSAPTDRVETLVSHEVKTRSVSALIVRV